MAKKQRTVTVSGFQAIETRFIGATNTKPSRIKATVAPVGRSMTLSWDHDLGVSENHAAACAALVTELEWDGRWVGGSMPHKRGYAFVCVGGAS